MKYIFAIILMVFTSITAFSQTGAAKVFNGKLNIFAVTGSGPRYSIQSTFNDDIGFYRSDSCQVGDIIYAATANAIIKLRIDTIDSKTGGQLRVRVFNLNHPAVGSFIGQGAVMETVSANKYPVVPAGLNEKLRAGILIDLAVSLGGSIASGVTDGDKTDVVVSGAGLVWSLKTTGVSAGAYTNPNLTVDTKGRVTSIANGAASAIYSTFEYPGYPVTVGTDAGSFVTANIDSVTFARTGGSSTNTEGTLTVPLRANTRLISATIHFSSGQAPGNVYYLNVDYLGTSRTVNGTVNSLRPALVTVVTKPSSVSDSTPATEYIHSSTPLIIGIADVNDNGTRVRIRYKITNYNQQVGSGPSILSVIFP